MKILQRVSAFARHPYMKQKCATLLAVLLFISASFTAKADYLPVEDVLSQDIPTVSGESLFQEPESTAEEGPSPSPDSSLLQEQEPITAEEPSPSPDSLPLQEQEIVPAKEPSPSPDSLLLQEQENMTATEPSPSPDNLLLQEQENVTAKEPSPSPDSLPLQRQETMAVPEPSPTPGMEALPEPTAQSDETAALLPGEAPAFSARIEFSPQGYMVRGSLEEFVPGILLVHPLYSLDGETYQPCGHAWDLPVQDNEKEGESGLSQFQNRTCLYDRDEPLKSYLAGTLDRFYLKLRITRESGITYETQAAVIERGDVQQVPETITANAGFAPAVAAYERPYKRYGRYQITIKADASPEDISALLPDTLPVTISFSSEDYYATATGTIDCPVTWKPLSLPPLTAGESVTIPDAAGEIIIPAGTQVTTPRGIFELAEPLGLDSYYSTDEVRLVLNVVPEDGNPTGALTAENAGLEIAFHLKPTGATAIRAYTFSQGDTEWKELPQLPLLAAVNAQPSAASSSYALVLPKDQEPYLSYLAVSAAGGTPRPFLVGLKIEGGAYDGRQLVLPWPHQYDLPPNLPDVGGSGGNENNAGSDNKGDSTGEGQRPGLPQPTQSRPEELLPASPLPTQNRPEGQLPALPRPSETPDAASSPGSADPGHKNLSDPKGGHTSGQAVADTSSQADFYAGEAIPSAVPVISAKADANAEPSAILTQQETDFNASEQYTAPPLPSAGSSPQIEIAVSSPEASPSAALISSGQSGNHDTSGKNTGSGTVKEGGRTHHLPVAVAFILGGCITVALGQITVGRFSGRTKRKFLDTLRSIFTPKSKPQP